VGDESGGKATEKETATLEDGRAEKLKQAQKLTKSELKRIFKEVVKREGKRRKTRRLAW